MENTKADFQKLLTPDVSEGKGGERNKSLQENPDGIRYLTNRYACPFVLGTDI